MKQKIPFLLKLISVLASVLISCKNNVKENISPSQTEYYSNGRIKSYTENNDNGLPDGVFISYYPNGGFYKTCNYKNGKIEGDLLVFYENGRLKQKVSYKNDKPDGLSLTFFQSGYMETFRTIVNGKDTLFGVNYKDTFELTPVEVVYFNPSGDLVYKEYLGADGKIIKTEGKR